MTAQEKLRKATLELEHALSFEKKAETDSFYYSGIEKCFEVALEYAWKYFRQEASDAGLEVIAPRDAIKQAAVLGLIEEADLWLGFLKLRNIAVHDYLGIDPQQQIKKIGEFLLALKKVKI